MKKLCVLLLMVCFTAHAEYIYEMDHPALTDDNIMVTGVEFNKNSTVIHLNFHLLPYEAFADLWIAPPDSPEAFVILDPATKHVYMMTDYADIPVPPDKIRVEPGKQHRFSLIFEKIPMRHFHLIEGLPSERKAGQIYWDFIGISLPR